MIWGWFFLFMFVVLAALFVWLAFMVPEVVIAILFLLAMLIIFNPKP